MSPLRLCLECWSCAFASLSRQSCKRSTSPLSKATSQARGANGEGGPLKSGSKMNTADFTRPEITSVGEF